MLITELARMYDLDLEQVQLFLNDNQKYPIRKTMFGGLSVDNKYTSEIVKNVRFKMEEMILKQKENEKKEELIKNEKRLIMNNELSKILITSGFNFDGYTVTKYSGYISGDDVIQVDRGQQGFFHNATDVGDALMNNLSEIRRNALKELKEQAYALGCNAIIGVDFDYLTLDPETAGPTGGTMYMPYVFGVTANGNAVIIEKD